MGKEEGTEWGVRNGRREKDRGVGREKAQVIICSIQRLRYHLPLSLSLGPISSDRAVLLSLFRLPILLRLHHSTPDALFHPRTCDLPKGPGHQGALCGAPQSKACHMNSLALELVTPRLSPLPTDLLSYPWLTYLPHTSNPVLFRRHSSCPYR